MNGLCSLWVDKWRFKLPFVVNVLSHVRHLYDLTPIWVRMCAFNTPLETNFFWHWEHLYGFSPRMNKIQWHHYLRLGIMRKLSHTHTHTHTHTHIYIYIYIYIYWTLFIKRSRCFACNINYKPNKQTKPISFAPTSMWAYVLFQMTRLLETPVTVGTLEWSINRAAFTQYMI